MESNFFRENRHNREELAKTNPDDRIRYRYEIWGISKTGELTCLEYQIYDMKSSMQRFVNIAEDIQRNWYITPNIVSMYIIEKPEGISFNPNDGNDVVICEWHLGKTKKDLTQT